MRRSLVQWVMIEEILFRSYAGCRLRRLHFTVSKPEACVISTFKEALESMVKTLAHFRSILLLTCLCVSLVVVSGCSLFGLASLGPEATFTPTVDAERALVPTFTPTPDLPVAAPTAAPDLPVVATAVPAVDNPVAPEATAAPAEQPTTVEPTVAPTEAPAAAAKFIVTEPLVNVRSGPDTAFGLAGSVEAEQTFDIKGKNGAGDWWLICCVNGQEVWIFGQLGRTENAESVALAENIPAVPTAAPVAVAPTAAPVPTQAPAAAPTEAPAPPPPSADPCAGIGGDGCKFKVREGPQFAANGGNELKLQLFFIHSGIDGGQPQGSYFVVLTKDGQNLGVSDGVRSIANSSNEGPQGRYNYEYKIGLDKLPGNTVAGNYTMFVLDGNGERDSQDLNFTVPEGQGEVRVVWDQG